MWNIPNKERLAKIPKLYQTENIPLKKKFIYLHFYIGNSDWFVAEYDGDDLFFGFCILNGDLQNAEWGYVSFSELRAITVNGRLEVDCVREEFWQVRKASEIEKIRVVHGWPKKNTRKAVNREQELILKVKAGHFEHFQDLFAEVTSPYSDYLGIDPYPIWEVANGHKRA